MAAVGDAMCGFRLRSTHLPGPLLTRLRAQAAKSPAQCVQHSRKENDMAYWLADTHGSQTKTTIKRFDPRFWSVNFPRPMMAALTTTAPDALRIDAVF